MKQWSDRRFVFVACVYVSLVVGAAFAHWPQGAEERDYIAARELPHNHRLAPEDLRAPASFAGSLGFYLRKRAAIVGKYVKPDPICEGDPVRISELADKPDMRLGANVGAVVFSLPADSHLDRLLDVGAPVVLLGQDPDTKAPVAKAAAVHAVLCEPSDKSAPAACFAVLEIAADTIGFVTKNAAALHLALSSEAQNQVLKGGQESAPTRLEEGSTGSARPEGQHKAVDPGAGVSNGGKDH
jgi:hypothetical protein